MKAPKVCNGGEAGDEQSDSDGWTIKIAEITWPVCKELVSLSGWVDLIGYNRIWFLLLLLYSSIFFPSSVFARSSKFCVCAGDALGLLWFLLSRRSPRSIKAGANCRGVAFLPLPSCFSSCLFSQFNFHRKSPFWGVRAAVRSDVKPAVWTWQYLTPCSTTEWRRGASSPPTCGNAGSASLGPFSVGTAFSVGGCKL